jgi:hypothetical protein
MFFTIEDKVDLPDPDNPVNQIVFPLCHCIMFTLLYRSSCEVYDQSHCLVDQDTKTMRSFNTHYFRNACDESCHCEERSDVAISILRLLRA